MFVKPLTIKKTDGDTNMMTYEMLQKIKKAKYPDITYVSICYIYLLVYIFTFTLVYSIRTVINLIS